MKFIHTADWQIGMKAVHVDKAGGRARDEHLSAARRVIEIAGKYKADFILLAGDTFEDNGVERILAQKTVDILTGFGGPVFIIPGNHDPLVPGSVWEHPAWRDQENLHVLTEETPVETSGGILYPCPAREKRSGKNPTAWIKNLEIDDIKIGLAHGTVEGVRQDELEYPVPREATALCGLDYLALSHWHSTATYSDPDRTVRMAYSGTHETTRFGERDSGNILLVNIEEAGKLPEVTPVKTGGLEWLTFDEEIRSIGDLGRIRSRIEAIRKPSTTLIDLKLSGFLDGADREELTRLSEIVISRFLFGRIDTSRLRPLLESENWPGLPPGVVREAALQLHALSNPGFSDERPDGATPEIAFRALIELCALFQGFRDDPEIDLC